MPEIQKEVFIKSEYKEFYNNLTKHQKGNKMQEKFEEIISYFNDLKFEKNLILLFSQWNQDEELFERFKENPDMNISGLDNFIKYCNENGLLLDDIETNTKDVSQKVIDFLATSSDVDPQFFGDNEY